MIKQFFCPLQTARMNYIFFLWVFVAAAVTCIPYIYGMLNSFGHYNWLIPPFAEDGLAYMAWVKQASLGDLIFKMKFTTFEHDRFLFHPLFLFCGWFSAITGLEAGFALFVGRLISIFFFFYILAYFLGILKIQDRSFWLSLLFLTYSSGLGWVAPYEKTADLVEPGLITLWGNTWIIIYPLSWALTLLIFGWFYQAVCATDKGTERRKIVGAGLMVGLLAFIHPYDVVFCCAIVTVIALLYPKKWKCLILFIFVALPPIAIQYGIAKMNPAVAAHSSAKMMSPPIISYLVAMGVPGFLAVISCGYVLFVKRSKNLMVLIIWAITSFCLAYSPIWFQAKMVSGVHIPVCILSAVALDKVIFRWINKQWLQYLIIGLFFIATLPNHYIVFKAIKYELQEDKILYYVPASLDQALQYLDKNSLPDDVVLAYQRTSSHIPGRSGNTVIYGHWAQSVDQGEKMNWLGKFIYNTRATKNERIEELRKVGIDYILIDSVLEKAVGKSNTDRLIGLGEVVFANNDINLVKIN